MVFWSVIIFALIGCEPTSLMAGEIKDACHNVPRALLLAGVTVAFCYMTGTLAVLLALSATESSNLEGLGQAIDRTCSRLHIGGLTSFAAVLIAFSNTGAADA